MAHPERFEDDDPYLARVREIALSFPQASERLSHGHPAFFTTKLFCFYGGSVKMPKGHIQHPDSILFWPDPDEKPAGQLGDERRGETQDKAESERDRAQH